MASPPHPTPGRPGPQLVSQGDSPHPLSWPLAQGLAPNTWMAEGLTWVWALSSLGLRFPVGNKVPPDWPFPRALEAGSPGPWEATFRGAGALGQAAASWLTCPLLLSRDLDARIQFPGSCLEKHMAPHRPGPCCLQAGALLP